MPDVRLEVNEELMDTLAARVDELERRLAALLTLLRRESVRQPLGLKSYEFAHTDTRDFALKSGHWKYQNQRNRAIDDRRQKDVLTLLSRASTERLEELLRDP